MEAQDSIGIGAAATSGRASVGAVDLRICIIDYGMGNLGSVRNALKFLGIDALISSDRDSIAAADALILPRVGAFGEAMSNLRELDIIGPLGELVVDKRKPFLGICLGMQLIAQDSTEMGYETGLGWLDGHVRRLDRTREVRLPHVGWSTLDIPDDDDLFARIESDACFYFRLGKDVVGLEAVAFAHSLVVEANAREPVTGLASSGEDIAEACNG